MSFMVALRVQWSSEMPIVCMCVFKISADSVSNLNQKAFNYTCEKTSNLVNLKWDGEEFR